MPEYKKMTKLSHSGLIRRQGVRESLLYHLSERIFDCSSFMAYKEKEILFVDLKCWIKIRTIHLLLL